MRKFLNVDKTGNSMNTNDTTSFYRFLFDFVNKYDI